MYSVYRKNPCTARYGINAVSLSFCLASDWTSVSLSEHLMSLLVVLKHCCASSVQCSAMQCSADGDRVLMERSTLYAGTHHTVLTYCTAPVSFSNLSSPSSRHFTHPPVSATLFPSPRMSLSSQCRPLSSLHTFSLSLSYTGSSPSPTLAALPPSSFSPPRPAPSLPFLKC